MESLDYFKIVEEPISLDHLITLVSSPEAGAISTFSGTTRNNFEGKKVLKLQYEAYKPMAEKEMKKICQDIRNIWEVLKIAMVHRIGDVPIGESSVIIAVSSAHRRESLDAVSYAIDAIKSTVPIWKKEYYENSASQWKENKECCFSHGHMRDKVDDSHMKQSHESSHIHDH